MTNCENKMYLQFCQKKLWWVVKLLEPIFASSRFAWASLAGTIVQSRLVMCQVGWPTFSPFIVLYVNSSSNLEGPSYLVSSWTSKWGNTKIAKSCVTDTGVKKKRKNIQTTGKAAKKNVMETPGKKIMHASVRKVFYRIKVKVAPGTSRGKFRI